MSALARRVGRGDREAASRLARALLPFIRRIVTSMLNNSADADDVTQQALVEVLRAAARYEGRGSVQAWSRMIVLRVVWAHLNRSRTQRRRVSDASPETLVAETPSHAAAESLVRPIQEYVARLPDEQRRAVSLAYGMGYTIAEIAELTQAPVSTIKSRIQTARRRLRAMIRRDAILPGSRSMEGAV